MSLSRRYVQLSYQLFGKRINFLLNRSESWKVVLQRANLNMTMRMYISTSVFTSILLGILGIASSLVYGYVSGMLPIMILSPVIGILLGLLTALSFILYPGYRAKIRKQKLEAILPAVSSYMTAMASAGVNPDKIFLSLSKKELEMAEMQAEASRITRDITIFGYDLIRAMLEASKRSPSPDFSSFLEGIVGVFTSGGDLQLYLEQSTRDLMVKKLQKEKDYIEQLGLVAELFLVVGVVAPIIIIVLIALLTFTSGSASVSILLFTVTVYGIIPILQITILILLDGIQPED